MAQTLQWQRSTPVKGLAMRNQFSCFRILTIIFAVVMTAGVSASEDHFVITRPDGTPAHIFNLPRCIPDCNRDDQMRLTDESLFEEAIVSAINSATETIVFSQYTFSRRPVLDALIAASARGVRVRGIMDEGQLRTLTAFCQNEACAGLPAPFSTSQYLDADIRSRQDIAEHQSVYKGGSNSEKLALLLHGMSDGSGMRFVGGRRLMHHKFVLIDDTTLLNGSGNWSSTAVSVNLENLNFSHRESDPKTIAAFGCMFSAMWGPVQDRVSSSAACQEDGLYFSPAGSSSVNVVNELIQTIAASRTSIDVAMHHLVHPGILLELSRAALRNVRVRILTDDDHCMKKLPPEIAAIVQAGGEIRYMPTTCDIFQLSHNKYGVFDGRKLINGSGNWSIAGLERNFENFQSATESLTVDAFTQAFEKFWQRSVTKQQCSCNPSVASCRERYCFDRPRP